MQKLRVLFYTELWANAGIESVIMSLFRNFNLSKVQVDIMASQNLSDFYDEEITKLGGTKIITLCGTYSSPAKRMFVNQKAFQDAIIRNKYDIVHIHMCNAAAMVYGKIAKKNGVKMVVYHSHNTNIGTKLRYLKTIVHTVAKYRYEKYADLLLSCSDLASKWMFTSKSNSTGKVIVINNAIDLNRFDYSPQIRHENRMAMGIEDKFVVGHIGRFAVAKNHSFLIDIFSALHKKEPNSVLLLIGEGEDESAVREKVHTIGLDDSVIFYGTTKEIPTMLWSMDAFLLPSLFEGNPVVGIEAQAAGTPCFFADTITRMCSLTNIVEYKSLAESPDDWADMILKVKEYVRVSTKKQMVSAGYDITAVAQKVQALYESILSEKGELMQ